MFEIEILIFTIIFVIARYSWVHRRFYYLASKIPTSDFDKTLKGIYSAIFSDNKAFFHLVNKAFDNVDVVSKTWLGPLFVGIMDLEDVKNVMNLKHCLDKPYIMKFLKLQKGSLFGDLDYWKSHRKIMNPHFGIQSIREFVPIFNARTKILVKNLAEMEGKGEFNIHRFTTALTLETILNVMEYKFDLQNRDRESRDVFIENLIEYNKISSLRMFKVWLHPEFLFRISGQAKAFEKVEEKSTLSLAGDILKDIREKTLIDNNNNNTSEVEEKPRNFIRALTHPKFSLTDDELMDEIKTVIAAAQDTSAIASSTTLLMLAMHKEEQKKVLDELYRVLGTKTKEAPFLDLEQLNELEYLEMAINESMRLFPVVPLVMRINAEELELRKGYILPIGTFITISIYRIHRNKHFWGEDAEIFRPERFSKENLLNLHPYAFIPFTKGPRMCIGWKYAMTLMKIQLANVLLKYEVDTSLKLEELEVQQQITLSICQGYQVSLKERQIEKS